MEGNPFEASVIDAAMAALGELPIAPNYRASADFRRKVAGVLARRAVNAAFGWAREV